MDTITAQSEQVLADMLRQLQQMPDEWMSLHVNLSPMHSQMLRHEGISRKLLTKIHAFSIALAKKLNTGLEKFKGKIMVFEDSDVLALLEKNPALNLDAALKKLCNDFTRNGMIDLLVIEEMKDRLSQLVEFSEEKKQTAQEYRLKQRAVDISENPLAFTAHDPELAQAIERKRRAHSKGCVLVIDDDLMMRCLIASMLQPEYDVIHAKDSSGGIISYIDRAPDAVFLDIYMPGVNGHDTLKLLKRLDPHAYVIMLSGLSTPANVITTKTEGADGFIRKPFSKEKLYQYLKHAPSLQPTDLKQVLGWSSMKNPFRT